MFEINEEFDVDEEFLESAFHPVEKGNGEETKENNVIENDLNCSFPSSSKGTLPSRFRGSSTPIKCSNQDKQSSKQLEFLEAWKSNSENNNFFDTNKPSGSRVSSKPTAPYLGFKRNIRARKFPGPAGLLPERQSNTSLVATEEFIADLDTTENNDLQSLKDCELLSQKSGGAWERGAWGRLMECLGPEGESLLDRINLRTVRASAKHSRCTKVPFLAVLLQSVDSSTPDPSLLLKDLTGEMHGALHRDVWEEWGEDLGPGCVLVLRSVGVIRAGVTSRQHFLNITANNIASIYTTHKSEEDKVINVNPILEGECPRIVREWEALLAAPRPTVPPPSTPPRLYSNLVGAVPSPRPPVPRLPAFRPPGPRGQHGAPGRRGQYRPPGPRGQQRRPQGPRGQEHRPPVPREQQPRPPPPPRLFGDALTPPPRMNFPQANKRPRMEVPPASSSLPQFSPSIFSSSLAGAQDTSLVESLLDGIDADSLFDDF